MKKSIKITMLLLVFFVCHNSNAQEDYSKVRINLQTTSIRKLASLGIETDHGLQKVNYFLETWVSTSERKILDDNTIEYLTLIDNARNFYKSQNQQVRNSYRQDCFPINYVSPVHYNEGSMAGFLTYAEMINELDSMFILYPNLITNKASIGPNATILGDSIWHLKISDNPGIAEGENQILYTGVHHAREPMGMQNLIFYMWYLLENYATDSLVKYMVDHTELYFVPCINPDGYKYNEFTDPAGGGLWRKNRRDNMDGNFGVDLNRNYGYNWGFDDNGSSPFTSSLTYRGATPFSEPETQLIRDFCNTHNFRIALNYHSYGNLLIYPWGYIDNLYTPDSGMFVDMATNITLHNNYKAGTANQTVNYIVNGSSDDWMYGEQNTKNKIFAYTPETGYDFWPSQSDIDWIVKTNMYANVQAGLHVGKYAAVEDITLTDVYVTNPYLVYKLSMKGLDSTGTYTVTVNALQNVSSTAPAKVYSNLKAGDVIIDSIAYVLQANISIGDEAELELAVTNGNYTWRDTLTKVYNYPSLVFSDNASTMTKWISASWNTTTQHYVSAPASITDSPFGNYNDGANSSIILANALQIATTGIPELTFYARWMIEPIFDYAQLQISDNNGVTWYPLCGRFTDEGSDFQDPYNPVYDGLQPEWVQERIDLSAYKGKSVKIRFVLVSDFGNTFDGFYFDDVAITGGVFTSTNELNESMVIHAFPNPVNNQLQIFTSFPSGDEVIISAFDVEGKKVHSQTVSVKAENFTLNTSNWANGVYTLQITSSRGQNFFRKIVKLRN
ncbi:MAG: immune inhibitor A [Bacteroidetes bacterium]|nr:immune inhibitor A [Bacteroidota bacterium]